MDVMTIRARIALSALAGAIPLLALAQTVHAAPAVSTNAPRPAAAAAAPREDDMEQRLSKAVRTMPQPQRLQLRARMRVTPVAGDEHAVTGAMRPNTFRAMRAKMIRPRDTSRNDPAMQQRYVRKLDAICRTLPADARRGAGMNDDACAKLRARAAAAPG